MTGPAEQEVLDAAAALVEAFGRHDTAAYFAAFRPDATFVFHSHAETLRSRAAYEELWRSWEADGFRVLSCTSSEQHVQLLGDAGVFTHRVSTRLRPTTDEPEQSLEERETIVFISMNTSRAAPPPAGSAPPAATTSRYTSNSASTSAASAGTTLRACGSGAVTLQSTTVSGSTETPAAPGDRSAGRWRSRTGSQRGRCGRIARCLNP